MDQHVEMYKALRRLPRLLARLEARLGRGAESAFPIPGTTD